MEKKSSEDCGWRPKVDISRRVLNLLGSSHYLSFSEDAAEEELTTDGDEQLAVALSHQSN